MSQLLGFPHLLVHDRHRRKSNDPTVDIAQRFAGSSYLVGWSLLALPALAMMAIFASFFLILTQ